ncbi:CDP-diacylglycerol---serine O-phosphatidyltransferase [Zhouia amylolytica]|uniref:CDP-diacylglycerol---serine O-phosphatidyltransferase n=2 Tax=Zhouia amylolytica TaxID=376730 RepID=A0A1I6QE45_9FLAO|nr:CDP-alcohol phosphatidyltransferase family protein [Zhouia amylolytica]ETN96021.1 putative phosphatidylserine synthase [Zhouia amylolytica AD3]MCQ0111309.1 CDP-alcohol phosphatidyltransferase family protein [Zhouia amylolytica]SFS50751.1 CDP-diacylglycerol---serine O-phosphatidyltransferase [Zhouia amylolytica]
MKKHIPNLITLLNLFCGSIAAIFAVKNQLEVAAVFVFLGIFFDFFDGLTARLLKVQSDLGIQLDSLADMVTSGLVPGIVMYQLLHMSSGIGSWEVADSPVEVVSLFGGDVKALPFLGLLITLASAYRLAKFNIDEDQATSFIGLPTPANALFILSLPLILFYQGNDLVNGFILNKWFLIAITLLSSYMLNARIPLFALKFKDWKLKSNATRYSFLSLSVILLILLQFIAIPIVVVLYVLMSAMDTMMKKKQP